VHTSRENALLVRRQQRERHPETSLSQRPSARSIVDESEPSQQSRSSAGICRQL
jgi:hypothetical protein